MHNSAPPRDPFTDDDVLALEVHGISLDEARHQFEILQSPPPKRKVVRACTKGDGLEVLDAQQKPALEDLANKAIEKGRVTDFIPASGAASRMFADLIEVVVSEREFTIESWKQAFDSPDAAIRKQAQTIKKFINGLSSFAFFVKLRDEVWQVSSERFDISRMAVEDYFRDSGYRLVMHTLLYKPGLGYASLPKALLEFHQYSDEARTALEEHLENATLASKDGEGHCRLHFTVSEEHRTNFNQLLDRVTSSFNSRHNCHLKVGLSSQAPSTDTISLEQSGAVFRNASGQIVFRPGGHGSLITNLAKLDADIVYLNNIDNVQVSPRKAEGINSKKWLVGRLLEVESRVHAILKSLLQGAVSAAELERIYRHELPAFNIAISEDTWSQYSIEKKREALKQLLNRPIRVCGMVKNEGEPGGGPFWIDTNGKSSVQIVERAEIDESNAAQVEIFKGSTHFNPVRIVCGLRDVHGQAFDLTKFVDQNAVFCSTKTASDGRKQRIFERPGLWNGAMAHWITLFVEVESQTFTPVKSVFDLLRDSHLVSR